MLLWEAVGGKKLPRQRSQPVIQPIGNRLRSLQQADRCNATTRVGRRCRCRRAEGSEFCAFHDPQIASSLREKAQLTRRQRQQQRAALPAGYLRTLTTMDGIATALESLYREVRLGVVSTRTAGVLLAIIDRLLEYDKLVSTVGRRRVDRKRRAVEVRQQVDKLLAEMETQPATPSLSVSQPGGPRPAGSTSAQTIR